jgi:hypothetical protein
MRRAIWHEAQMDLENNTKTKYESQENLETTKTHWLKRLKKIKKQYQQPTLTHNLETKRRAKLTFKLTK